MKIYFIFFLLLSVFCYSQTESKHIINMNANIYSYSSDKNIIVGYTTINKENLIEQDIILYCTDSLDNIKWKITHDSGDSDCLVGIYKHNNELILLNRVYKRTIKKESFELIYVTPEGTIRNITRLHFPVIDILSYNDSTLYVLCAKQINWNNTINNYDEVYIHILQLLENGDVITKFVLDKSIAVMKGNLEIAFLPLPNKNEIFVLSRANFNEDITGDLCKQSFGKFAYYYPKISIFDSAFNEISFHRIYLNENNNHPLLNCIDIKQLVMINRHEGYYISSEQIDRNNNDLSKYYYLNYFNIKTGQTSRKKIHTTISKTINFELFVTQTGYIVVLLTNYDAFEVIIFNEKGEVVKNIPVNKDDSFNLNPTIVNIEDNKITLIWMYHKQKKDPLILKTETFNF